MKSTVQRQLGKSTYTYVLWAILIALPGTTFLAVLSNWFFKTHRNTVAYFGDYPVSGNIYKITVRNVQNEIEDIRRRMGDYAEQILEVSGLGSQKPEDIAMQMLRSQKTIVCAADRVGLHTISPDYVARKSSDVNFTMHYLADLIPASLFRGADLNSALLKKYIERQGLSEADYTEMIQDRFKGILLMGLFPTVSYQPRVSRYVDFLKQQGIYTFETITVPLSAYIAKARKKPADEAGLREYYMAQNKASKRYWTPEKRSGTIWTFAPEDFGSPITESDERLFYGEHRQEFGKKTFEEARKEIGGRLKFDRFMKRFHTDIHSMRQQMATNPKEFADYCERHKGTARTVKDVMLDKLDEKDEALYTLFSLAGPGSMQVIDGKDKDKGVVVVLETITKSAVQPFEQVKAKVEQDYYTEKATEELGTILDTLAGQVGTKDFAAAVAKQVEGAQQAAVGPVKAQSQEEWQKIAKQKLPADRMRNMVHVNDALVFMRDDAGILIYLKDMKLPDGIVYDESKQSVFGAGHDLDVQRQELLTNVAKDMKIRYTASMGKQQQTYYEE
jgi:hypothetical protein